jgi:ABC-type nitrate/sulfonate/bicarbonate transport system substrate-binding protein
MTRINIAGVPEHFNYPWIQAIELGLFHENGLDVHWSNVPEGTGKLCQLLREGYTDLAIVLTEGILKDISLGNPSVIVQKYVESPLLWGIHVAAQSPYFSLADLQHKKAAISRIGSGSQLMAYVNAHNQGWDNTIQFEIVHTIDGAVEALTAQKADYFMWEHFMTKPLVDRGIFRRLADCPTPWPCFVIAVRISFLEEHPEAIKQLLACINHQSQSIKQEVNLAENIAQKYQLQPQDVSAWLAQTNWSQHNFNRSEFEAIQEQLNHFSIISSTLDFDLTIHTI